MVTLVDQGLVPDEMKIEVELLLAASPTGLREEVMRKLAEQYYELDPATRVESARKHLFRASDELRAKVRDFAQQHGLTIVEDTVTGQESDAQLSRMKLGGSVGRMSAAFNVQLHWYSDGGESRYMAPGNESQPSLPPGIAEYVVGILGFDRRPVIRPTKEPSEDDGAAKERLRAAPVPLSAPGFITAPELARRYNFPPGLDGSGQKIGVILCHGGLHQTALDTYLQCLELRPRRVAVVNVQSASNTPSSLAEVHSFLLGGGLGTNGPLLKCPKIGPGKAPQDADVKNMLQMLFTLEALIDVEIIASVAPGAELSLYFTPDDALGIEGAIQQAEKDDVGVLVLPWGFGEGTPGQNFITPVDWALYHAVMDKPNMTILCATGDNGSTPSRYLPDKVEAFFPASSPWVVACGGTTPQVSSSGKFSEGVWNEKHVPVFGHLATGGGFSSIFARPLWQKDVKTGSTMRGVPDISINAAFATGLWVWFGSANGVAMGTSTSTAMLGGLVALINQGLGRRVGILTPLLYDNRVLATMRRLSRKGNNSINPKVKLHPANRQEIWNPCTGLGSPDGVQLLAALRALLRPLARAAEREGAEAPV